MIRSKIQRIKFFLFFLSFLFSPMLQPAELVFSNNKSYNTKLDKANSVSLRNKFIDLPVQSIVYNFSISNSKKVGSNITSKTIVGLSTTYSPRTSTIQMANGMHIRSLNYGAFLRGIFVIIGLSVLVMAYMMFRGFRLSKTRTQMVRKYGVLTHRQDVEMKPLPLDDDDDDDTVVFDASNISSNNRLQSQNV